MKSKLKPVAIINFQDVYYLALTILLYLLNGPLSIMSIYAKSFSMTISFNH